jgi:Toastrack DUF4097
MNALPFRRLALAAGLALLALNAAACDISLGNGEFSLGASGRAADTWTHSYTVAEGGRVEVVNTNGTIEVEQSAGPTLEVTAERTAKAATDEDAKALLAKVRIDEAVTPESVRLETKAPKSYGRGGVEVKYFLKVPQGLRVAPHTSNGTITLTRLTNDIDASTTNGGIHGEELTGSVAASTTNGGIALTIKGLGKAGVRAETTNGGVAVELPADAGADVAVQVTNGGIGLDNLRLETTGDQSRRHVEGRLNGGGPRVELSTTNGGIRLTGK